jgi:hypothetical protein
MSLNREKRDSERKNSACIDAEFVSTGIRYQGVIENICDKGVHAIAASEACVDSFIPEKFVEINFTLPSGDKISLHCEVRWVHINKTPIHGLTYRMGMEVVKNSPEYAKFLNTLT